MKPIEDEFVFYQGKKFHVNFMNPDNDHSSKWRLLWVEGVSDITAIKGLENLENLDCLDLTDGNLTNLSGLDSLFNLSELCLSGNKIEKIEGLDSLLNLKSLALAENYIVKIEGLGFLTKLKDLRLQQNKITKIENLSSLTNLQYLDLSSNSIGKIEGLCSLNNLTTLLLERNSIRKIEGLENCEKLTKINLEGNPIPKSIMTLTDNGTSIKKIRNLVEIARPEKMESPVKNPPFSEVKFTIFFSYSTNDTINFSIKELADLLENKSLIKKVIFWEGWSGYPDGSIISFMESGIKQCDVFIPFFTNEYNNSQNCFKEYESALAVNKPMIPIFKDIINLPILCRSKVGVNVSNKESSIIVDELYEIITSIV